MAEKTGFLRTQIWSIILIVLIIAMGIEILFLVRENRKLQAALKAPRGPFKLLNPEDKVPPLVGLDLNHKVVEIEFPSPEPTVLFWFSATCPSCEHNIDFWKQVYQKYHSDHLLFYGVTNTGEEETADFVKRFQLDFPVLIVSDLSLLEKYRVEVIPQTMLIDANGVVMKIWPGPLSEIYQKEMEDLFSKFSKS
jgi:peroxiredoxin